MGWTLDSIDWRSEEIRGFDKDFRDNDHVECVGHCIFVTLNLKFDAPSVFRRLFSASDTDSILNERNDCVFEWKERVQECYIQERDNSRKYSQYGWIDQYDYNHLSYHFNIWVRRYVFAYRKIFGLAQDYAKFGRADVILQDIQRKPVKPEDLVRVSDNNFSEQAEIVRNYLAKNGGYLVVTLEDTPVVSRDRSFFERLLRFDVGIRSLQRIKFYQYLKIEHPDIKALFCAPNEREPLRLEGYTNANDDNNVPKKQDTLLYRDLGMYY